MNSTKVREVLDYSWWFVPLLFTAVAVAVSSALIALDGVTQEPPAWVAFSGGPAAARTVLSTMASSVLTFTGLTFSIVIVVLVLTSGQFSPRVIRTFLHDRSSQSALGLFVSTYVYLLIVLRVVRDEGQKDAFVPRIAVTVGFTLTAAAIFMFVYFVHHIAQSVRAATIINRIADETRQTITQHYPAPVAPGSLREEAPGSGVPSQITGLSAGDRAIGSVDDHLVPASLLDPLNEEPELVIRALHAGLVNIIRTGDLVDEAERTDRFFVVVPKSGDFVRTDGELVRVYRSPDVANATDSAEPKATRVRAAFSIQSEGSTREDVAFGFRQLVDIAEKALSPGVNDPTTSVQCLNLLHDLLWHLAVRPMPNGVHAKDGVVRVLRPVWSWSDYIQLSFNEIRHWGADSVQVHSRMRRIITDLLDVVKDHDGRREPLVEQLRLLDERLDLDLPETEHQAATRSDQTG